MRCSPAATKRTRRDALQTLAIDRIASGKYQPRTRMDETALNELADSIREQGVMQPILVRPVEGGRFEIIAGERRWRAAQRAGLNEVPALVKNVPDKARARAGADREHPARGPESAGGSAGLAAADRRIRIDARRRGESGRPLAQRGHQPAAADAAREARAGLPAATARSTWAMRARCSRCRRRSRRRPPRAWSTAAFGARNRAARSRCSTRPSARPAGGARRARRRYRATRNGARGSARRAR